jgi:hypothetical protein
LSGQIASREREELEGHLSTCLECRTELGDFAQITTAFPRIAHGQSHVSVPAGVTERFLARARSEGIPLSRRREVREVEKSWKPSRSVLVAFAAILAALAASYLIARVILAHRAFLPASARIFAPAPKLSRSGPSGSGDTAREKILQENADLRFQTQRIQTELVALSARVKSDQDALKAAEAEKRALSSRLANAENVEGSLRAGATGRDVEVAQIKSELEKLKMVKEADDVALHAQENELNRLREQTAKLETKLQDSEQLSAAANRAKDVIIARNLHIVDVRPDAGESGKHQRAFGRIFYAEGQSLVFYAYDLTDPRKLNAKIHFHVWGEKQGASDQRAKTLGVFHSDDKNDGRWVLTFDDPNVMAQIDSIFVTVESDKQAVIKPTGKKILYAYLGNKPNHP